MPDTPFPVEVAATHGDVPADVLALAEQKVRHVARHAPAPVLFARVAVAHDEDPAVRRDVIAKATLDVNGRPVRAHVAAEHFGEAVDLLEAKLRHGLEVLAEHRRARRGDTGDSGPGEWRHGDLPTHRPDHYPRPPEQREIVRRRSRELPHASVEEAALDLELLDQDWTLFTELDTRHDAVLARRDGGYTLQLAGDRPLVLDQLTVDVAMGPPVPTMTLAAAIDALVAGGLSYVFFVDADTGRGEVVYLRYDGHYGVVVPAEAAVAAP